MNNTICRFRYQGTHGGAICGLPANPRTAQCSEHSDKDATLKCTRCSVLSYCYVPSTTKVGDVLKTDECDRCSFDSNTGRTARVVALA